MRTRRSRGRGRLRGSGPEGTKGVGADIEPCSPDEEHAAFQRRGVDFTGVAALRSERALTPVLTPCARVHRTKVGDHQRGASSRRRGGSGLAGGHWGLRGGAPPPPPPPPRTPSARAL